ncbi:hypothetical protein RND81_09G015600 [Saponaria officinalis]|uniref:Uncharacterized protein n=1 Tax=Saponaria officinalis TaxID=3572 RepID=A0AAW1IG40_SAPOF
MTTSYVAKVLFLALLLFSIEMKTGEGQSSACPQGTVGMDKCSISECVSACHRRSSHLTGKCIGYDVCCCVTRANED